MNLAKVFEEANDIKATEILLQKALKKYKYSKKIWIANQHFNLQQNNKKVAKDLLSRSLQSLEKHKHIEVISQYALKEYDLDHIDEGRYLMEELLTSYPKRSDLWHIYIDKEMKCNNITYTRQLFNRMITTKYSSIRNMKLVFKKFLDFEKKYGNIESQEIVKQKAREYVSTNM